MAGERDYTPALGFRVLTPFYDGAVGLLTRERIWRSEFIRAIGLTEGERLLDVGCGTGSLALLLATQTPTAEVIGIDPDPEVLRRARKKAERTGLHVSFCEGFLSDAFLNSQAPFDVIVSSLVFHQVSLEGKKSLLAIMRKGLRSGGRICIADYGLQRTRLMRALFRATVQTLDGIADTQPNADGMLPKLLRRAGFNSVEELKWIPTPTGSISILVGRGEA